MFCGILPVPFPSLLKIMFHLVPYSSELEFIMLFFLFFAQHHKIPYSVVLPLTQATAQSNKKMRIKLYYFD
jgi:hypothetical protein